MVGKLKGNVVGCVPFDGVSDIFIGYAQRPGPDKFGCLQRLVGKSGDQQYGKDGRNRIRPRSIEYLIKASAKSKPEQQRKYLLNHSVPVPFHNQRR
jgi:hypothetical protein